MRTTWLLCAVGLAGALTAAAETAAITLPARTAVPIRLGQAIDTKQDRAGKRFLAHVAADVKHNGEVVLPRGTVCYGHLVESKRAGRLHGRAVLSLSLDEVRLNGKTYAIATSHSARTGKNHNKRNLGYIGGGAATGASIGAIAGGGMGALIGAGAGAAAGTGTAAFTGKRDIRLPAETHLTFLLRRPVTIRR